MARSEQFDLMPDDSISRSNTPKSKQLSVRKKHAAGAKATIRTPNLCMHGLTSQKSELAADRYSMDKEDSEDGER